MNPPPNVSQILESTAYDGSVVDLGGTRFHVFGRKSGGLGLKPLEASLRKSWPNFRELNRARVKEAWLLDVDAAMGGGPLDSYAIGVYHANSITPEFQVAIEKKIGWKPQPNTDAYVSAEYAAFPNPREAYLDDMVTHELGHLFFGFGLTKESPNPLHQAWFSLGIGMVYDRLAWDRQSKLPSPLFSSLDRAYVTKYKLNSVVDQRLVNPDTSLDAQQDLYRAQVYGHGKAYLFLRDLRERIGAAKFDGFIDAYLDRGDEAPGGYEEFLKVLPEESRKIALQLEIEHRVR